MDFSRTDRILLAINGATIHGTTRLQKYGFLLYKQHERELSAISSKDPALKFYDDWKPFWFGPFSESLSKDCVVPKVVHPYVQHGPSLRPWIIFSFRLAALGDFHSGTGVFLCGAVLLAGLGIYYLFVVLGHLSPECLCGSLQFVYVEGLVFPVVVVPFDESGDRI